MKRQKGFTLIEMVVSIALVGAVATGASSGIFYVLRGNSDAATKLPNLNGVQLAGRSLSRDAEMAKSTSLTDGAAPVSLASTPVTFYRTDYYNDPHTSHTTIYSLSGVVLQRNEDGQVSNVARNISAATISITGRKVTFTLSASDQSRTYQAVLRSQ